MNIYCKYLA